MAVANVHTLYAVDVDPITVADAVFIDQITDYAVDPAIQEILAAGDGQVDPTFVATMAQSPRIRFSSSALATILAEASSAFALNGLKIDADGSHDGCEFWFQKVAEGGTRSAGSTHIKLTIKEGLLLPRAINASQGGVATMTLEALATYDGTNNPIVVAANQALVGSPGVSELFTLGPVSINGTALNAIQNCAIDLGIQEIVASGDGQTWPTFAGIMSRAPLITLTTLEAISLSTFGLAGTAQTASDSVIYLRKIAEGGTRVADATAEHIKFTVDEGMIRVRSVGGAHGGAIMSQIEIRPTWDETNAILVIDPASAIT